jgi:hypothetical protein
MSEEPIQVVPTVLTPQEQIDAITVNLMQRLREEIALLKAQNPGQITTMLLLEPGVRRERIRAILQGHIATQLGLLTNPTHRVRSQVPVLAGEQGDAILREDWAATMQALVNLLNAQGIFGAPGNHLYRNTSALVTPSVIIANGRFRHRDDCSPPADVITHVFSGNAGTILFNYTRDPGTLPFTVVSATTDADNTQGQSPTWSYAFPRPALTAVPVAAIATYLGTINAPDGATVISKVTQNFPANTPAESVTACLGGLFTVRTASGTLPDAMTAFVSNQGSSEHIFLNTVAFTAGQDFFRSVSPDPQHPYRNRWKLLTQYPAYHTEISTNRRLPE